MAKKYILKSGILLLSALFLTLVYSCSEDDTSRYEKGNYGYSFLVGEWYCDNSNQTITSRIIYSFDADGSLSYEYNVASVYDRNKNLHKKANGLYNMDGDRIRIGIVNDIYTEWTDYHIDWSNNTLTLIPDAGTPIVLRAVVHSQTINVGETLHFSWTGNNGAPQTYSSSANMLASVNNDGEIKALSSGVVYITGHYPNGENIVCKLDIIDPENGSIPNFYKELRKKSLSDIMETYKGMYFPVDNAFVCDVASDKIKKIGYHFNKNGIVNQIDINYWFDSNFTDILSSLENGALGFESSSKPNVFLKEMYGSQIVCVVDPQTKVVSYYMNQNSLEAIEEYIFYDSLNELLDYHRSRYNDESVNFLSSVGCYKLLVDPNNEEDQEIFENLYVYFDGDNIKQIDVVAKPSVTFGDLEQWAEINYPYKYQFPGDNVYSHLWRQDWWNMNPVFRFYYIRFTAGANAGKAGIRYKKEFY